MARLAIFIFSLLQAHAATNKSSDSNLQIARSDKSVVVEHAPHDAEIANRLQRILTVTGWFRSLKVTCKEGVVILHGLAEKDTQSQWAEALAKDTDQVVAVINEIQVEKAHWFDLAPAEQETENLVRKSTAFLPYLVTSMVLFTVFTFLSILVARFARRAAQMRVNNVLMVELVSRLASLPVIMLGLYLVLRVCGLTGIAATLLGGTGALGLVAGFAMQNILANYFAGIMLSLRNPYTTGDVISVAGQTGVVQKLTTRGTILVDFDGNHIIIPNSTIYNNIIVNMSSNPKTRVKFSIGISYNDLVSRARTTILEILTHTPGVLKEPEPLVLVSDFLPNAVQISVYFWILSAETSGDKLKSVIIEKVKEVLQTKGYTLPGEIRQLGFPVGMPELGRTVARMRDTTGDVSHEPTHKEIQSEKQELLREASKGRDLDPGRDLTTGNKS